MCKGCRYVAASLFLCLFTIVSQILRIFRDCYVGLNGKKRRTAEINTFSFGGDV